jgi:hypothetical protein
MPRPAEESDAEKEESIEPEISPQQEIAEIIGLLPFRRHDKAQMRSEIRDDRIPGRYTDQRPDHHRSEEQFRLREKGMEHVSELS